MEWLYSLRKEPTVHKYETYAGLVLRKVFVLSVNVQEFQNYKVCLAYL